jgi:hypothetical protein
MSGQRPRAVRGAGREADLVRAVAVEPVLGSLRALVPGGAPHALEVLGGQARRGNAQRGGCGVGIRSELLHQPLDHPVRQLLVAGLTLLSGGVPEALVHGGLVLGQVGTVCELPVELGQPLVTAVATGDRCRKAESCEQKKSCYALHGGRVRVRHDEPPSMGVGLVSFTNLQTQSHIIVAHLRWRLKPPYQRHVRVRVAMLQVLSV